MLEGQKAIAAEITQYRNSGNYKEALALCRQATEQFPDNSFFPKLSGDIHRQVGLYDAASENYITTLKLIRPDQFPIFVKAYRNLEKSTNEIFMSSFREKLKDVIENGKLQQDLKEKLLFLLGVDIVIDKEFLGFAQRANEDQNYSAVKKTVEEWEARQETEKIQALAYYKTNDNSASDSKRIDAYLIHRLEKLGSYNLALEMIKKTQKPYRNRSIIVTMLRICRKRTDYSFVENELTMDEGFINSADFNIQYELVYYFRTIHDEERLEKTLRRMRRSATSSTPIARTLYNFYLSLNRFEDAQNIYQHIRQLEQQKKNGSRTPSSRSEEQVESEQAVWQRMKDLVSEQEHNRQMIALRDLLKGFSHELGQPITNIRYAIQLHQRKMRRNLDEPEDIEVLLSDILSQTDRLGTLLARFSPVVSPKNESGEFSIVLCAEKVINDLENRLHEQNIICHVTGSPKFMLKGDQIQFSQVFYNLILNSMQAIEKNGNISIKVHKTSNNMLAVDFLDDGPGIPEKNHQKIFEPFFSTKDPTLGNGGEGLGLYIVWNILKIFNATIRVDDRFHSGTKFVIQIQQ